MGNRFEETDSNHGRFRMILNRDYGGFGVERAVLAFDQDAIGKFQRTIDRKQGFARRAEFDDGVLDEDAVVWVGGLVRAGIAIAAAELDGNPHGRGFGKEPGQAAYNVLFESVRSCLGHGKASIP